ncbi:MAG: hypothetical protein DMF95_06775 [Acidobacteria bacterium]|nr:MAG: hypothetical protein DMF95_06775 [Acidobacteriota bacterium]
MGNGSAGLAAFVFWLALAPSAFAQNAQITGIVKDSSGGIIPGATVTARNVENGFTRVGVTDSAGEYRLPSLPPGRYSVATELVGFSTETRPDIVLIIDQTAIINFALKPAALSETITVTGESPIVDVTRSDVATSVSTQQIQDLPVASRRWIDLAMLTPGTSQDNIRGFFYRGNVNLGAGTREYSNGFVVDGVNNTWAEMGEPRQNFAMDAIQEFKVSTSTYKAEYGLATGGVLSVVTKSGTNQLHGSGLLFFRDVDHGDGILSDDEAGLPAVSVRRHDRRAARAEQDALLLRVRGDEGGPVPDRERARLVAAVRRHVQERAGAVDLQRQVQSPAVVVAKRVFPLRRGGRVPSDHHDGRAHGAERELRFCGAAPVGGGRPLVRPQRSRPERFPFPVRVREV